MTALIKAAKKEGRLNVIALPDNWANYGAIIKDFKAKYHINISDQNPEGSSAEEITAMTDDKGRSDDPMSLTWVRTSRSLRGRPASWPLQGADLE